MIRHLVRCAAAVALAAALAAGQAQAPVSHALPRETIEARLRAFSSRNSVRRDRLEALFADAGCTGENFLSQKVDGSRLPNLVCTLPGTEDSVIIVGAHFDCVDLGEGVVDNWSGASLLPSLYEGVRDLPRRHKFVFIGFTDEEKGLVGSESYARRLPREDRAKVRAMVNLDSLGLRMTRVWASHADPKLLRTLERVANALELPLRGTNVERIGTTDSESFARRKIPSITIHSVSQETFPLLHTPRDVLAAVSLADYYDTYRLIGAYLETLDASPEQ